MSNAKILEELGARLSDLAAKTPAKDIEKNARAFLSSAFSRLDLVTREEFEVQRELLLQTRQRLTELEARIAALEAARNDAPPPVAE